MNKITMAIQLFLIGGLILLAVTPIVLMSLVILRLRTHRYGRAVLVALSFVAGAGGGGVLVWNLIASNWSLPFLTTLKASVNAARYGHVTEHAAENLVVLMVFVCVTCGVLSAATAAIGVRIRARLKARPAIA